MCVYLTEFTINVDGFVRFKKCIFRFSMIVNLKHTKIIISLIDLKEIERNKNNPVGYVSQSST